MQHRTFANFTGMWETLDLGPSPEFLSEVFIGSPPEKSDLLPADAVHVVLENILECQKHKIIQAVLVFVKVNATTAEASEEALVALETEIEGALDSAVGAGRSYVHAAVAEAGARVWDELV